jgi:hypothetical protein
MENEICAFNQLINECLIADIALMDFNLTFDMGDVGARAGGEVIQDYDLIALGQEGICQVGSDKACSTGDKYAHEVSLTVAVAIHLWRSPGIQPIHRLAGDT